MCGYSISSLNDFQEGMSVWRSSFELDRQGCEEQDLHRSTAGIPEGSADAISVCHSG